MNEAYEKLTLVGQSLYNFGMIEISKEENKITYEIDIKRKHLIINVKEIEMLGKWIIMRKYHSNLSIYYDFHTDNILVDLYKGDKNVDKN